MIRNFLLRTQQIYFILQEIPDLFFDGFVVDCCSCSGVLWLFYVLLCVALCLFKLCNHLDGEERAGCFVLFSFLVSRDCCEALPHDVTRLSVVCDCGFT